MLAIKMSMLPIHRLPSCLYSVNCINIVLNVRNQILLHTLSLYPLLEMMTLEMGLSEDPVSVTKTQKLPVILFPGNPVSLASLGTSIHGTNPHADIHRYTN